MVYKIAVPNPSSLASTWKQPAGGQDWINQFSGANTSHTYLVRIATVGTYKMTQNDCQPWFEFALSTRGTTSWADSETTFDNSYNIVVITVSRIDQLA